MLIAPIPWSLNKDITWVVQNLPVLQRFPDQALCAEVLSWTHDRRSPDLPCYPVEIQQQYWWLKPDVSRCAQCMPLSKSHVFCLLVNSCRFCDLSWWTSLLKAVVSSLLNHLQIDNALFQHVFLAYDVSEEILLDLSSQFVSHVWKAFQT